MKMDIIYVVHLAALFLLCGCFLEKEKFTKEYINKNFNRWMHLYFWFCFLVLIFDVLNQVMIKDSTNIIHLTDVIANDLEKFIYFSGISGSYGEIILPAIFFSILMVQFVLNKIERIYFQCGIIICAAFLSFESLKIVVLPFSIQFAIIFSIFIMAGYYMKTYNIFCIGTFIEFCRKSECRKQLSLKTKKEKQIISNKRDCTVDLEKGILILIMLVGHYNIDRDLRNIIYSFHMMAFVFLSGYFYKKKDNICKSILHTAKGFLIPYLAFVVIHILFHHENLSIVWRKYILGMSFSKDYFVDVPSIGQVYFILLLFCVRIIYLLVDKWINKDVVKAGVIILISYIGLLLGNSGKWLPWSFDCAMYATIFYMAGHYCKKYKVIEFIKENLILYFVFTSIWAFMIYKGGMELAVRDYGYFAIGILGAISGTILLYLLCSYIKENAPRCISKVGACIGENTLYILIIHTIFGGVLSEWVAQVFDPQYCYHMVVHMIVQVALGVLVGQVLSFIKAITIRKKQNEK